MKVAVLGIGFGIVHIQTFLKNPDIDDIFVFSRSEEKLKALKEQYPIQITTNLLSIMENEEIKLVSIALPHLLHKEMAIMAMQHQKDVICEIPVGIDMNEIREIEEVEKLTGRQVMTNLFMRYRPCYQTLLQYVNEQKLGKLLELRLKNNSGPVWGHHPLGIHQLIVEAGLSDFDALSWIVSDLSIENININDVSADISSIHVTFHSAETAIYYSCCSMMPANYGVQEEYEAIFENGILHYQETAWTDNRNKIELIEYRNDCIKSIDLRKDNHYEECLNDCIQQIKFRNTEGLTNLKEAKKSLYLVEEILNRIQKEKAK